MFFSMNQVGARSIDLDSSNNSARYYWTYSFCVESPTDSTLALGFSVGCDLDDGHAFRRRQCRELHDLPLLFRLPDLAIGEERRVTLQMHCWESHSTTPRVKLAFTNEAARRWCEAVTALRDRSEQGSSAFKNALDGLTSSSQRLILARQATSQSRRAAEDAGKAPRIRGGRDVALSFEQHFTDWVRSVDTDRRIGKEEIRGVFRHGESGYRFSWVDPTGPELTLAWPSSRPPAMDTFVEFSDGRRNVVQTLFQLGLVDG